MIMEGKLQSATSFIHTKEVSVFLGVLSASLASLWIYQKMQKQRRGLPGPVGVPILGYLPFLGEAPHITFIKLMKKFGPVFQVYMGSRRTLVVNTVESARQVLVVQSEDFAGRPDFQSFQHLGKGKSMAFGKYGARVKLHKKIARSALRQFTANPASPIEEALWHEGKLMIDELLQNKDKAAEIVSSVHLAVGSIIYGVCFGATKQLRQDADFVEFMKSQNEFQKTQKAGGNPADLIPWLSVFFQGRMKRFIERGTVFTNFLEDMIEDHRRSYSPSQIRDITDALIKASDEYDEEEMAKAGLTKEHILGTNTELIGAGLGTVANAINWCVLYLVVYPEVQDKVQASIDDIIGTKLPAPADRFRMPYVEAVILETLRFSASVPFLLPHSTTCDTTLFDYDIPKDTLVFVNMYSVGRDPAVWIDPDTYNPTRFLDEDGTVNKQKAEDIFPFGGGKRRCLGENLARQETFIFLTMLFQRLRFERAPGVSYDLKGNFGFALEPNRYEYIVRDRSDM